MAGQWTTPSVCCRQAALALDILKTNPFGWWVCWWAIGQKVNCRMPLSWDQLLLTWRSPWLAQTSSVIQRRKRVGCLCKAARGPMTKGSLMIEVRGSDGSRVLMSSRSACLVVPCPVNIAFLAVLVRFWANSFNPPSVRKRTDCWSAGIWSRSLLRRT